MTHHQHSRSESTRCSESAIAKAATHVNIWPACDSLPAATNHLTGREEEWGGGGGGGEGGKVGKEERWKGGGELEKCEVI